MNEGKQASNAWRVLCLLFLANLFNFFDRAIPAILNEPIRHEWGLTDFQLGLVASAFTVVYAIAGLPMGRLADTGSRKKIMGWGLIIWSAFTGLNGLVWNFSSYLVVRIGVGIGEASYSPAASALIGDLFPSNRRSRALGIFMLGLPLGLILAFFTTGAVVRAFGSWRAPFFLAMVPGIVLAVLIFFIKEPRRGAAEEQQIAQTTVTRPIRKVLSIPTMWWLTLAGIAANVAAYSTNFFMVPLLQRYFGLPLEKAAITTGVIVGVTGLIGLTFGGWIADKMHQRSERGRLLFGAFGLLVSAGVTAYALTLGGTQIALFTAVFSFGWLLQYNYYTCVYPAIQDVVEPRLRATAVAVFFAALYLLGGAFGPIVVGLLSDHFSATAMLAAGASQMTEEFKADGLHAAMFVIPVALFITAIAMFVAARTFTRDANAMKAA
ncbi:MFS transporter [Phyllobacterium sp. OV277]|uniref:spinster family MFS transporter n=1 Tax=Phyllobacterium sp. OV277 TaxID=1882772 RepID=UPI000887962B|nr:MFS transporter [Phyllobacterium sp. OV277]SDP68104.1 Predicted arabinose efflux permease, MFS family [Phyllobacterium sp. OV277]